MTANNFVASKKHGAIWIATDAASYLDNGVVTEFRSKVRPIPEWSAVITGRGNSYGLDTAARELFLRASSFDELVCIAPRELPLIVDKFKLNSHFELIFAGFFSGKPMVFFIRTPGHDSSGIGSRPYLIWPMAMNSTAFGPCPSDELIAAASFVEPSPNDAPEAIERGLRKLLELQRRTPAEDGFSRVGGWAELTVIRPDGIDRRTFHHWPDDHIGERMSPAPIDWRTWDGEH
ncbi:hypothetical protein [Bradyrhizobium sp. 1(2017)]|uniref:hypothetical protein n=1 Tax=Bradyrhizobium sp. 1(2017) TaxID=1404888 RepID=UPI00140EEDB7|nr:hypothetical protein [Bradyrhizobium sp. 1(2017)]QIO34644.1 hypothetical protein HAP40_23960 [Bradyrhizobium sp. 1(2017)]